jgi:integrase/recombinase XerD
MSALCQALEEYLTMRRALGFKLREPGRALRRFVEFAEKKGASFITTELALCWAQQPSEADPAYWTNRLDMVRCFARYCKALDSRTEIPAEGLLPHRFRRKPPYLYSDAEILQIIEAAEQLPSRTGLRAATYSTLFGLVAVTGMRSSEPISLDHGDVDFDRGVITIRSTKFGKFRHVPIASSTQQVLDQYRRQRDHLCPAPQAPSFFLSEQGKRVGQFAMEQTFVKLSHKIGLRGPNDRRGPRLHDLRHTFAVRTILDWYRKGLDVERHLPKLATYLGHTHVNDTYWYLSATPELLQWAVRRLEDTHEEQRP